MAAKSSKAVDARPRALRLRILLCIRRLCGLQYASLAIRPFGLPALFLIFVAGLFALLWWMNRVLAPIVHEPVASVDLGGLLADPGQAPLRSRFVVWTTSYAVFLVLCLLGVVLCVIAAADLIGTRDRRFLRRGTHRWFAIVWIASFALGGASISWHVSHRWLLFDVPVCGSAPDASLLTAPLRLPAWYGTLGHAIFWHNVVRDATLASMTGLCSLLVLPSRSRGAHPACFAPLRLLARQHRRVQLVVGLGSILMVAGVLEVGAYYSMAAECVAATRDGRVREHLPIETVPIVVGAFGTLLVLLAYAYPSLVIRRRVGAWLRRAGYYRSGKMELRKALLEDYDLSSTRLQLLHPVIAILGPSIAAWTSGYLFSLLRMGPAGAG